MIASPTHYTKHEGGEWIQWPLGFPKPMNMDLLVRMPVKNVQFSDVENGRCLSAHSIRFDEGSEWDSLNGWRDGGGPR